MNFPESQSVIFNILDLNQSVKTWLLVGTSGFPKTIESVIQRFLTQRRRRKKKTTTRSDIILDF